ncbi:ABC transporter permease [Globicatella sanguinis]|nr:ABC transporter permease [Globicatella sanguinis]MDK7630694.1 ABC transporter permease [Globicatella sanguinis]WIK66016.1 ABC transporter permease [Globicatella sanguinis]WKT55421.1 ABC transporter permease [Globicatella sanguinis]
MIDTYLNDRRVYLKSVRYLWMLPAIIVLIVFMGIPLFNLLVPTLSMNGNPLSNYLTFFESNYQVKVLIRTIRVATIVTLICALLGIPTAYYISGLSKKWKSLLMAVTLFPLLTNSVVRAFAWINILGQNGIINKLLVSSGVLDQPLVLLNTEFAIIIGSVYLFLPTMIISLVGVIDSIEPETLEAAATLGANPLTVFRKIIIPLSIPGTIIGSILVFTGTLTAYTTPQLLGGNKNMLLSTFLRQNALTLGNWELASVVAFIMILITLVVNKLLGLLAKRVDKRLVGEAS